MYSVWIYFIGSHLRDLCPECVHIRSQAVSEEQTDALNLSPECILLESIRQKACFRANLTNEKEEITVCEISLLLTVILGSNILFWHLGYWTQNPASSGPKFAQDFL